MKKAFITGITGQDGSYMTELLLEKGYEVAGLVRRNSSGNLSRIKHLLRHIQLFDGDMTDTTSIHSAIKEVKPDEVYNLAAMSFVPHSWKSPELTLDVNATGLLRILEATDCKVYQASTSEMYGSSYPNFNPASPYGTSKLAAHLLADSYRRRGRFVCCGICFNHESPRRGDEFVTKKIANFFKHKIGKLHLGNLEASRDWGFAGDYVEAMWIMMQQKDAKDYEIATGETHTIKDFLDLSYRNWKEYVVVDESLKRANDIPVLKGNPESIMKLGWKPKVDFPGLVRMMNES